MIQYIWPDLGKPTFWAHWPGGIKTTVSLSKKGLHVSNFTARKFNSCLIKMCNKKLVLKNIWNLIALSWIFLCQQGRFSKIQSHIMSSHNAPCWDHQWWNSIQVLYVTTFRVFVTDVFTRLTRVEKRFKMMLGTVLTAWPAPVALTVKMQKSASLAENKTSTSIHKILVHYMLKNVQDPTHFFNNLLQIGC